MTTEDPLSLVGTTVWEKYEIERVVGVGGFAIVYRARHNVWKRPVAIKVFRALGDLPAARRDQLVKEFIQEGALLAELSERSAAICPSRDVGQLTSGGRTMTYMVLEWLEGHALEHVLDDEKSRGLQPRSPRETLQLLEPVAEALALAHRRNIAHRDVKPANIFVLGDPRGEHTTKILDFGIAKVVQDAQRAGGAFAQTQGVVSSFTPAYGAPEQFSRTHGATGPWTDVFAMALIFTELVTHVTALRGDDLTQLAFCAMDPKRRPTPRTLGAEIPDAVEAVLRRALAVSPEERFQNMAELWESLRASLAMEPSRAFAGPAVSSSNPQLTALAGPDRISVTGPPVAGGMFYTASPHAAPTVITGPPAPSHAPSPMLPSMSPSMSPMQHTMPAATPAKGNGGVIAIAAVGIVAFVALIGGGLYFMKTGPKDGSAPPPGSASATSMPTVASATPPPEPQCPDEMAKVTGGKFFMGSDDKADEERERPAHQVTLATYCIDLTEVTVAKYKECSDKGECKRAPSENEWPGITRAARKIYDPLCNIRDSEARATHPINCIDWELANAFCAARSKRLPTEAEWEFATRGSDGRRYPWGDDNPSSGDRLNACGKECVAWGKKHPHPDNPLEAMYQADDGFATTRRPVFVLPARRRPESASVA
jgi:formylglycine-generating enzyme required for sulfatase activity